MNFSDRTLAGTRRIAGTIDRLLKDKAMAGRLAAVAQYMQAAKGTDKAAQILGEIATTGSYAV